jgi:hypothetical protein
VDYHSDTVKHATISWADMGSCEEAAHQADRGLLAARGVSATGTNFPASSYSQGFVISKVGGEKARVEANLAAVDQVRGCPVWHVEARLVCSTHPRS